jgi:hypothetical protein
MMNFDKNPIGILNKQQQKSNDLPTTVEITVGMKVMVPVKVATQNFQIKVREVNRKYITQSDYWSDCHQQYPMTAAYRFTDYSSQGQTLPYVTVDIAKPPSGGLDLFNLYVALSWSLGCETIQLLHNFDDQMFLKTYEPDGETI